MGRPGVRTGARIETRQLAIRSLWTRGRPGVRTGARIETYWFFRSRDWPGVAPEFVPGRGLKPGISDLIETAMPGRPGVRTGARIETGSHPLCRRPPGGRPGVRTGARIETQSKLSNGRELVGRPGVRTGARIETRKQPLTGTHPNVAPEFVPGRGLKLDASSARAGAGMSPRSSYRGAD